MYTSLRFRKWQHHVLDSLQRTDLPVFVKGHVTAAARRSRTWFYYGSLLLATVYVVSMLQFHLPTTHKLLEPPFQVCRRGPQSVDGISFLYHGNERIRTRAEVEEGRGFEGEDEEDGEEKEGRRRRRSRRRDDGGGGGASKAEPVPDARAAAEEAGAETREEGKMGMYSKEQMMNIVAADSSSSGGSSSERSSSRTTSLAHDKYYHFQGLYVPAVALPKDRFAHRRGVVITASGRIAGQAIGAYVTSYILRKVLNCQLPIEVYFVGPRETFGASLQAKLRELGDVTILSLPGVLRKDAFYQAEMKHLHVADRRLRSYAAKPYAMYAASFEEVLLFDAGVIPFVNPEAFFDFEGYQDHGYHLFRDYRELDRKAWGGFVEKEFCADVDELHGLLSGTEADSSCVVMHKGRAWDSLLVTMAMNGPLQPFTYSRLNGDKDTWVLAASLTYQNFSTSHTTPGYFMREAGAELSLLETAYAGRAQPLRGHVQFRREEQAPGGVVPLYLNNQLLNMTEYPGLRNRLAFGLWEDYGYPFCGWRTVNPLLKPAPHVLRVLDAVSTALVGIEAPDECLCKWFRCRFPAPFGADSPFLLRNLFR